MRSILRFVAAFAAILSVGSAHAQLFRAYLASTGSDGNPCTLAAPCRLLPAALAAVADGGEVWMLDSANFNTGMVNITKSVSVLAVPGEVGSIIATGGANAIDITTAGITVALRNVVIVNNATSPGSFGIFIDNAKLFIEDSLLANLPNVALWVQGAAKVYVKGTLFRNNASLGITASNGPTVNVIGSRFIGNGGVDAQSSAAGQTTEVNVTDSAIASSGTGTGAAANASNSTATARVTLTRVTIADMSIGLSSRASNQGTAVVTVANSTVTGCSLHGIQVFAAVINSLGNNYIGDNAADSGSLTGMAPR
jgi:hypothetical protein